MHAAFKLRTTVLPGNRIEFTAPELPEGAEVEVFVSLPGTRLHVLDPLGRLDDVMEFLDSQPPVPRTAEQWAVLENEFQAERDSWDR
jgi:hypothetical protein